MSAGFLGSVVALCPMVIESGLLPFIMARSFSPHILREEGRLSTTRLVAATASERLPKDYCFNIYAKLSKATVDAMQDTASTFPPESSMAFR